MPWEAFLSKLMPEAEGVLHLGKKVSPDLAEAYAKKLGPMGLKRLESAGMLDSGSQFLKHMETNLGKEGARDFLKQEGINEIKSVSSPGRNLMGVAALPMAGASQVMNPFGAVQDLGQKLKPAVDAYNNTKDAVAGKLTNEMNFGKDPGFQKVGTSVFSNALDPMNAIPGGAGIAAQGAMMLPDMTGAKDPSAPNSPQGESLSLQKFAQGGPVGNLKMIHHSDTHTILQHPNGHEVRILHAKLKPEQLAEVKKYAEGGAVEDTEPSFLDKAESFGRKVAPAALGTIAGPLAQSVADDYLNPPAAPDATVTNPQIAAPPQQQADPMAASAQPMKGVVNQQIAGIQHMADAVGAQGKQELSAGQELEAKSMDLSQKYTQNLQGLDQERQAIMHDIGAGHIDPDHYVNSMSTGSKVGTAIGLILGGFAPQGTKNPAMEYLQKQIDNDMMAQKADLGRKENLLSANLRQYGNLHDAMSMTKVIQNEIYASKIAQAAASAKSPMAQAAAEQAKAQVLAPNAQLMQEVAQRQTAIQGVKAGVLDASQAIPHLVPKEEQSKAFDDLGKVQAMNQLHEAMAKSAQHLRAKFMNGALSPNDTESAKQAFAGTVQKLSEGRYNYEAAQAIVNSLLPQTFDKGETSGNKDERMDQFFSALKGEHEQRLKSYGVPVPAPRLDFRKFKKR